MTKVLSMEEQAVQYALHWHAADKDLSGLPVLLHPLRVMAAGNNQYERVVGVLHDTVEDTFATLESIRAMFGQEIRDGVDSVTRRDEETYREFIERCALNPKAVIVKVNDIHDNLGRCHPDPEKKARLRKRYLAALKYLDRGVWK